MDAEELAPIVVPLNDQERRKMSKEKAGEAEGHGEATKNIVVIGDGGVGKTSLLYAYQNQALVPSYTPTMYVS